MSYHHDIHVIPLTSMSYLQVGDIIGQMTAMSVSNMPQNRAEHHSKTTYPQVVISTT